jgi:glutathione synthase/RimK-type ligase-like ATP-grasp enzyme
MDIGGNTPIEFLLEGSDIELAIFYVVPDAPLPSPMPNHDIAMVIAPDGDAAHQSMLAIAELVAIWPRPVLNAPAGIGVLDRDRLYRRLHGVAGLEIPQTARARRDQLKKLTHSELALSALLEDASFPLIIRPIGSHAGFGLAKVEDPASLSHYLAARNEEEFFISRFVDYAGADGMFRKYRIVCVGAKPFACHMAIAEEWMVWYLNSDMAVSVEHRMEEAFFMEMFDGEFAARHAVALAEISARTGLDYLVIDCAETKDGKLLVFEADNTAIVHDMDPPNVYPYKSAQMQKVFKAFQDMLIDRAEGVRANAA